ncbi:RICIN domain-containing protein [Streptomyces flaveolus]|uniref:RICIN domain-containing protein n=1 Tax=Streptomyces flaveolus TaxID=67297 RepID=UPI0034048709
MPPTPRATTTRGHREWGHSAGKEHQQWRLVQKKHGYFAIQNRNRGLFLSVHGESNDNGTALVQWPGGDGDYQQFCLG